jgi:DNA-binding transcriptional ArsR family regulator
MSRPAVSKHLRILLEARLVREQRSGRQRIYRLEPAPLEGVLRWVETYRAFWQGSLTSLKRHIEGDQS